MQIIFYVMVGIVSYFVGGLSIANIVSRKVIGKDISEVGSGNKGASNVIRNCGWGWGGLVLLFDALKATAVVVLTGFIFEAEIAQYIAAVMVIVGHIWPVMYGFKGGKGAASSLGAMVVLIPEVAIYVVIIIVLMTLIFRTMSLTSISGLVAMIVFVFTVYKGQTGLQITSCIIFAILIFCHRENISRLIKGKEAKVKISEEDSTE